MYRHVAASLALAILSIASLPPVLAAEPSSAEQALVAPQKNGAYQRVGPWLRTLHRQQQQAAKSKTLAAPRSILPIAVNDGRVAIDFVARDPVELIARLRDAGAANIQSLGALVSAQVPVSALGELAQLDALDFATPALARTRVASQGRVVSQGDASQRTDDVRRRTGLDGTGVIVGVLSDSYECNPPPRRPGAPNSSAADDVLTLDAPPEGVAVLDNGPCPASDEGRAMTQVVHDVAPGATLRFHTANQGQLDFAIGILQLQESGANVIVDDLIYFAENMFSDGIVAQAADYAVERGVAFFSAAGNDARASYESRYREVSVPTRCAGAQRGACRIKAHDFGRGDTYQRFEVTQDDGLAIIVFSLQWDQPFLSSTTLAQILTPNGDTPRGAEGDLDLLIYDRNGQLVPLCPDDIPPGVTCQIAGTRNVGRDAVDLAALVAQDTTSDVGEYSLRIVRVDGEAPRRVKYVTFENAGTFRPLEHDTRSGTVYGHSNAQLVEAVGASAWYFTGEFDAYFSTVAEDTPGACVPACLNDFSSAGGVPLYLDRYGKPVAVPRLRLKPGVTGPDGGNSTFFANDSTFDDDDDDGCFSPISTFITPCLDAATDELPNFFGTSASAPHVAGIAALMLQKNPRLAPAQVYGLLRATAKDMRKRQIEVIPGPGESLFSPLRPGYDFDSGFGFVDAQRALRATPDARNSP